MSAPPPSKPDRRVSRIRLSSQWVLCREGAALRPRPQECRPDFRCPLAQLRRADSAAGKPLRALASVLCPLFFPSFFHFPASLRSTVVTRCYYGRSDSHQPDARTVGPAHPPAHWRVSLIIAGVFPAIPSPTICGLSEFARLPAGHQPAAAGFMRPPSLAHADRIEFTATAHTGRLCYGLVVRWFRCSPPRIAATQLRFDTARFLHRTEADFHRFILLPSQAHWRRLSQPQGAGKGCAPWQAGPRARDFPRHFARGTRASTLQGETTRDAIIGWTGLDWVGLDLFPGFALRTPCPGCPGPFHEPP